LIPSSKNVSFKNDNYNSNNSKSNKNEITFNTNINVKQSNLNNSKSNSILDDYVDANMKKQNVKYTKSSYDPGLKKQNKSTEQDAKTQITYNKMGSPKQMEYSKTDFLKNQNK